MTYEELRQHVQNYFGDKSRSQGATKADLLALADECHTLAESLQDDADDLGDDDDHA